MGEHTQKRFIYFSQKQGRNTYLEQSEGILSDKTVLSGLFFFF